MAYSKYNKCNLVYTNEELGGDLEWVEKEKKVNIKLKQKTIELWLENNKTLIDGVEVYIEVAPQIVNGRTMVPLRYVMENLGYTVSYDSGRIIIRY